MKKNFVRILSPMNIAVALLLDMATIVLTVIDIEALISEINIYNIIFAIVMLLAIIVSVLYTKQVLSNGIYFYDDCCEFNMLDDDNKINYADIVGVETYKDTSASLKKGFVERYSVLMLKLNDNTTFTVNLGLTTKKSLKKIKAEFEKKTSAISEVEQ